MNPVPKRKRMTSVMYLEFIRDKKCLVHQREGSDAHHLISKGAGGPDYCAVPLCRTCHDTYHRNGLTAFEAINKINLWKEAHALLLEYFLGSDLEWQSD